MKYTIDTKKIMKHRNINLFYAIMIAIFAALLLFKLIIPIVFSLLTGLLSLFNQWNTLTDVNFKFIGGIFFFIVGYKVFESLASIFLIMFNNFAEQFNLWRNKQ